MLFEVFANIAGKLRGTGLKKVPGIKGVFNWAYRVLEPSNCIKLVKVEDFQMFVDIKDMGDMTTSLTSKHTYHPQMTNTLREAIEPRMTCVDIGANIGYFTIIISKLVGPSGKVYAFEPDETNFNLLEKNLDLNGCGNVILDKKAVSNTVGRASLSTDKINYGGHSLVREGKLYSLQPVLTSTLDTILGEEKVDFVKIDVEGAEPLVLQGMSLVLDSNPNIVLIVEYLPSMDSVEHLERLVSRGFKLWHISEYQKSTSPITPFLIKKLWGKEIFMNILARRDRNGKFYTDR